MVVVDGGLGGAGDVCLSYYYYICAGSGGYRLIIVQTCVGSDVVMSACHGTIHVVVVVVVGYSD